MSGERFGFSETEWATLKAGPWYVLSQVAGADSLVDQAEGTALANAIRGGNTHEDDLVSAVMSEISERLDVGALPKGVGNALEGLGAIREILAGRPDAGAALREALLAMGSAIAESSGAQMTRTFGGQAGQPSWRRSAGTSAMERAALEAVAEALGLA